MKIDWPVLFRDALGAARSAVEKNAPQIEDFLREIGRAHEDAIRSIGDAYVDGDIDAETFASELDDEAATLAAELRVAAVMSKAIAQRAANAFRDTVLAGVNAAVAAVL